MKQGNVRTLFLSILLGMIGIVWVLFSRLFPVFSYIDSVYFAFDKVPGHFFSLPIQLTLYFFLFLSLAYGLFFFFLMKKKYSHTVIFMMLGIVLFISLMAAFFTYPVGALDLFNYVLVGKLLVFYHQNPFLIPFDNIGSFDPLAKYAIFLQVTTGYGPWWLYLTGFVLLLSGTSSLLSMILGYKLLTILFFLMTGLFLYQLPEEKHYKILAASIYLLNPFLIFEGVVNAHNDILVSFFIILAWWAGKRKNMVLFLSLILAGLIKFYALALSPLFFFFVIRERWNKKEIITSVLLGITGLLLLYLPFWENGKLIGGILEGLKNAQVINGYSPYSLLREYLSYRYSLSSLSLLQYFFMSIFLLIFVLVVIYALKTRDYFYSCITLLLAFLLMITIYQPWYVIPVLALASLSRRKRDFIFTLVISSAALLSYPVSVWTWFHSGWSVLTIHLFLASFIALPSLMYLGILIKDIMTFRNRAQDLR